MRKFAPLIATAYLLAGAATAGLPDAPESIALLSARSGGDATSDVQSRGAFTQHVPGLDDDALRSFAYGNRIFSTPWVEAPASVAHFDGLGPFFSNRSCAGCHVRDGRGRPPEGARPAGGAVVKLGVSATGEGHEPDPHYGSVLSERAVRGVAAEGRLRVEWEAVPHVYPDGSRTVLRHPRLRVTELAYGRMAKSTRISLRIAPAVIGVGLLESVGDSVIAAMADPDDADGDGVSGRVHWQPGGEAGAQRAGRLGWKATKGSVAEQVATALVEDMGITTPSRPSPEISPAARKARARVTGGEPELEGAALEALVQYCRMLAVPGRRNLSDPAVRRGAARFREAGCTSCHVGALTTSEVRPAALSRQVIHPFSDLLLHDMGPELSDGMPEADARAAEWRTPPLWGIGLATTVNGPRFLLHDGRARSLEEAILWHGGEAQRSRDAFRFLSADARNDLIRFLDSL